MKTLTKMFLLSCWCLLSISFAKETLDEIKANQEQQLIQEKTDALELQNQQTQIKEPRIEEESIDCEDSQESAPVLRIEEDLNSNIQVPDFDPNVNRTKEAINLLNAFDSNSQEDLNLIGDEITKEMLEKGFSSVEEYLNYLAANEAALTKEGAVSFETYLQGLDAKEQAVVLEYVLQNSSNEGVIVNNNKMPHFKGFNPERNPVDQDKVEYYENLKANPPQDESYESSRDCADTDNGATDSYGDGCDG